MELTRDEVKKYFNYSNGDLFWKVSPRNGIKVGDKVGTLCNNGYLYTTLNYRRLLVHRVIFLYHFGYLPKLIDHADGDCLNNRVENLRECNRTQNNANSRKKSNSDTPKGVFKRGNGYVAQISIKKKTVYLGMYRTVSLAEECYNFAAELVHGEFARSSYKNGKE